MTSAVADGLALLLEQVGKEWQMRRVTLLLATKHKTPSSAANTASSGFCAP